MVTDHQQVMDACARVLGIEADVLARFMGQHRKTRVLSIGAWAKETGIKTSTLRRAIGAGHLRALRLGNGPTTPLFVRESDLEAWLEARAIARKAWQGVKP